MTSKISIRPYDDREGDFATVLKIVEDAIRRATADHCDDAETMHLWGIRAMVAIKQAQRSVVALYNDAPAGVIAFDDHTPVMTVNALYVDPPWQGTGVARTLMDLVSGAAAIKNAHTIQLNSSAAGRRFYYKAGFRPYGLPSAGAGLSWNFPMVRHFPI